LIINMSGHAVSDKTEANHFEREDTIVEHDDSHEPTGAKDKAGKLLTSTAPKDGDLGARWLASYTGPRPVLTDENNNKIRNRIDAHL
jgi:hypothetical protein